jgi:C-terminal processing protease CtpA/Prc
MKLRKSPYPSTRINLIVVAAILFFISALGTTQTAFGQSINSTDLDRGHVMLKAVKDSLKGNYYDPNFHGVDIETRFKLADDKIKEAKSNGQIFAIIAQTLMDLKDSHTFFLPPSRAAHVEYGWRMQMIGDTCFVTSIKPGSDAEAKGLKPGDIVLSVDGYAPTRENMWVLNYLYHALKPQPGMRVIAKSPGGQPRQLDVAAEIKAGKKTKDLTDSFEAGDFIRSLQNESRLNPHRFLEMGDELMIWKMPDFEFDEKKVDGIVEKFKRHKAVVLDLRGNGGGYEVTLQRLLGNFFDHDVKIGDIKRRKETRPLVAKTQGSDAYKGKLIVLIDSESGSAAELFARVVQLEKRGTVIGDRSAGAVMRSKVYTKQVGLETIALYAVSITDADITMTDGQSLENIGVTPDELLLLSAKELAAQQDSVLSHAAELAGVKLEPEKAGALFPIEWTK